MLFRTNESNLEQDLLLYNRYFSHAEDNKGGVLWAAGNFSLKNLKNDILYKALDEFYKAVDEKVYNSLQAAKISLRPEENEHLQFRCFLDQQIIRSSHRDIKALFACSGDITLSYSAVSIVSGGETSTTTSAFSTKHLPDPVFAPKKLGLFEALDYYFSSSHFYKKFLGLECHENLSDLDELTKAYDNYHADRNPLKEEGKGFQPYLRAIQKKFGIGSSLYFAPDLVTIEPRFTKDDDGNNEVINHETLDKHTIKALNKRVVDFVKPSMPKPPANLPK